jgi:hypothetical protein
MGTPFTMRLTGRVAGATLELVGEMTDGVSTAAVRGVDPTPLAGPGFGVRTGGFVRGFGGANANGALEVDVDDVLVPEPDSAASGVVAMLCVLLRGRAAWSRCSGGSYCAARGPREGSARSSRNSRAKSARW